MKIFIQRAFGASVKVDSKVTGSFEGQGILALIGFGKEDKEEIIPHAIKKIIELRIFPDEKGRFDKSLIDINGSLLLVPQFTLYADTKKGRRPDFFSAMEPEKATSYFDLCFQEASKLLGKDKVSSGIFGADMKVSLLNDGPVSIMVEM